MSDDGRQQQITAVLTCIGDECTEQELRAKLGQLAGNFGYGDILMRVTTAPASPRQPAINTAIESDHIRCKLEDGAATVRVEFDGEDEGGAYCVMDPQHLRSGGRALLSAAQELNPQRLEDYSEGELAHLLTDAEERLADSQKRWDQLREKVESTLGVVQKNAESLRAQLATALGALVELPMIEGPKHEEQTATVMHANDAYRRAYAIYDAIRSVKVWVNGYL
jgi:hypothetical protein